MDEFLVLIFIILVESLVIMILVRDRTAPRGAVMGGDGWYDYKISDEVHLRFYQNGKYWLGHKDIPPDNILEEGKYQVDDLNWIRWSPIFTKDEYEVWAFHGA